LAGTVCSSFEQNDWPYYLADYHPAVSAELSLVQLWEIFTFLSEAAHLGPKKKRLLNALKKAGELTEAIERRVELCVDSSELDDMLIGHRPNPRSRAQAAARAGLGPLADTVQRQETEEGSLEELAEKYVGTHKSLKSLEDVLGGLKDILAERFAYDETARAMAREFCFEDGFFSVLPKNKKDPRFAAYRDRQVSVQELPHDELLKLMAAEKSKQIRLPLGVQLFRITEVLRQHFIENPDAIGFDLICEAIDESWQRLLHSVIEKSTKERLYRDAESKALLSVVQDLVRAWQEREVPAVVLSVSPAGSDGVACVAVSGEGRMLGAAQERLTIRNGEPSASDRVAKMLTRHRPSHVVVKKSEEHGWLETAVRKTVEGVGSQADVVPVDPAADRGDICKSAWMKAKCADLEKPMQQAFGLGLSYLKPLSVIADIGTQYFDLHPMQPLVSDKRLAEAVGHMVTESVLHKGIPIRDIPDSPLMQYAGLSEGLAAAIRAADIETPLSSKADLLSVKGMTEEAYRNIAGYVILPSGIHALDATLVHPYFYGKLEDIAADLGASTEGLVVNPALIASYASGEFEWQLFVRRQLVEQLSAGQRYAGTRQQSRRKLRLDELHEGMVVQGKVTNISPFGVFVNINAVCDGLIHISQLADAYVETPEQVVSLGEVVNVRVLRVDAARRRISLSMKGLGPESPRVRPSASHINTLIDHFSNR
jgi:uncharacterized protein